MPRATCRGPIGRREDRFLLLPGETDASRAPALLRLQERRPRQDRPGYTLFELVLVLALLIVLTTIIYPSLDAMYGEYRLTQAADMVRAAWATARSRALDEGRPYRFAVVPDRGNYRVAPDSADFWAGNGDMPEAVDAATPPLILADVLPRGVRFTDAQDARAGQLDPGGESVLPADAIPPDAWSTAAVFLPDGTARDDVEIVFTARGARPLVVRLRALTGVVTVRPL